MAIRDTRDEQTQTQPLGATGHEAERGVALEHRVGRGSHPVHLEEVIHERQCANTDRFGSLGERGDAGADAGRSAGPVETGDVEIELHTGVLPGR